MIARRLALSLLLLSCAMSCADLAPLNRGECGNRVIDADEECDTFAESGRRCRPPGDAFECRYDCSDASCPAGWACDKIAKVCRQPTGTFAEPAAVTFETNSARLLAGDFDGDGRDDLLAQSQTDAAGRSSLRAIFFDSASQPPAKTVLIPATAMSPAIYNLDGDGTARADLVFSALNSGMNVMLGQANRSFGPIAYSRFPFPPGTRARFVRVNLAPVLFGQLPMIFIEPEGPGKGIIAKGELTGDPTREPIARLDRSPGDIVGEPVAANIVDGATNYCEEIVWAWRGSNTLVWVPVCDPGAYVPRVDKTSTPRTLLTLPPGEEIVRPPLAGDFNGDGHVDLLVAAKARAFISFGRGDGTFSGRVDLTGVQSVSPLECELVTDATGGKQVTDCGAPLAVHFPAKPRDAYDRPVAVFPRLVVSIEAVEQSPRALQKVAVRGTAIAESGSAEWTVATIADLNANGYLDIAAASDLASDISFFNGTPVGLFNPGRIATEAPIRSFTVGDFDGDLVNDLAFTEIGAGDGGRDGIAVSYGKLMSPPDPPMRLGAFNNIVQIGAAKATRTPDTTVQIGLVYEGESDLIAILEGNGDRQLLAPYGLAAPLPDKTPVQAHPYVNVPGRFDGSAEPDVFLLAFDEQEGGPYSGKVPALRAWFAKGVGAARFDMAVPSQPITGFTLVSRDLGAIAVSATARAADVNGDGRDELVVLAPDAQLKGVTLTLINAAANGTSVVVGASPTIATGVYTGLDLSVDDLDGDGKLDAVCLLRSRGAAKLLVAWGNGAGFDAAAPTVLALPADAGTPRAMTTLQLDLDAARELAIGTDHGVFVAQVDASRAASVTRVGALPAADAIVSADVNGDGLADLATSKSHRVSIHLARPVR